MWNVSLQASIFEQRIKVIFIVCSRTAHLFYFRELKNIETNHEKNLYCVMNRKVTGHYFFAEKERKKNLLYKQTPVIMISKKVVII